MSNHNIEQIKDINIDTPQIWGFDSCCEVQSGTIDNLGVLKSFICIY